MFNGVSNAYLYTAARITVAVALRDQTLVTHTGTAFFVQNSSGVMCLVTNRHMLDAGYNKDRDKFLGATLASVSLEYFSTQSRDTSVRPDHRLMINIVLDQSPITFAADYFEDVAAFIDPKVLNFPDANVPIEFFLTAPELADDIWIEANLSVCDFVAFPGFPPWHDQRECRPILRTGTIASDPRANYSDVPQPRGRRIAYEAFSFGGSSGSPVFATQKGFQGGSGITVAGYREGRIVGINAGHLEGTHGRHSGVSYFIKSSAILDLIEK